MTAQAAIATRELAPAAVERELRIQLAAAYRLVDRFGWTDSIYGHLTVRVPGPERHFLINPFGLAYDEVTASNLVKIDCDGNIVGSSNYPINRAGFVIHSAVHMIDEDSNICVMHTHTRAGMAVAATAEGLQQLSQAATAFFGRISYHDYEGISLRLDERERLVASLGGNRQMILKNHGLLTLGRSVPEAFMRLYLLEQACRVQVDTGAAGTLAPMPDAVARVSYDDMSLDTRDDVGQLEFAAWMRMLDRSDRGYRH
ncbi:MAG: class II aldolase/adducin family protein [Alphaproteobacteria bacterium]|nr:class II aldolase/adducin family protein [Alphaproteobacteria bacterium]